MKIKDMKQAVKIFLNEWYLGIRVSGTEGDICGWIYLFSILEETEKIIVYKENNKLIGLCGYTKYNSNKHKLRKKFYSFLKNRLMKSKKIKNKEGLKEYYDNYSYTPKQLDGYFDGEVSILIVDENYRGKGIGKKLLLDIFELAKLDNVKKLQILTDESCDYKFYESLGCQKVFETDVNNYEYGKLGSSSTEVGYVYEKILL